MTFKKSLYLIGAFLITSFILFFYFSFNGNPISKAFAKKQALAYLEMQFPENNYAIQDNTFNFKDASYYFYYTLAGNNGRSYQYSVGVGRGLYPNNITSNYLHYDSENFEMSEEFSNSGTVYIKKLTENLDLKGDIYYYVQVPVDYVEKDTKWSPTIEFPVDAEITVLIEQHFESEEKFIAYVNSIMNALNDVNFNQLYVENRNDDQLIYTLKVNKGEKAQIEKILKNER
ncbi:hypothetical protein [Solibacillus sp. CAU 1738]|uniref:YfjL-like protein n=1 Tax=Solibacillus sp. CAU 1738 TaxID=3140363 RepID=UPI0032610F24